MCIKRKTVLEIILGISILGMLFSGYLSFTELSSNSCSLGGCSNIFGVPVCVYGLIMYLVIFIISILGLKAKK